VFGLLVRSNRIRDEDATERLHLDTERQERRERANDLCRDDLDEESDDGSSDLYCSESVEESDDGSDPNLQEMDEDSYDGSKPDT
jgi:hypothetical protein